MSSYPVFLIPLNWLYCFSQHSSLSPVLFDLFFTVPIIFLPAVHGAGLVSVLLGTALSPPRRPHEPTEHTVGTRHLLSLLNESLFSTYMSDWSPHPVHLTFSPAGSPHPLHFASFLKPLLSLASHFVRMAVTVPSGPLSSPLCTQPVGSFY